jgi:hypothetical protein
LRWQATWPIGSLALADGAHCQDQQRAFLASRSISELVLVSSMVGSRLRPASAQHTMPEILGQRLHQYKANDVPA